MKIHILRQPASEKEIQEMMEELETYIKLAVDVERGIVAGGGEYHADCEEILLEEGSRQEDIWGVDWYPESRRVEFVALLNIRPRLGNRGMEIEDPKLRTKIETIVRQWLDVASK
jgi:hypothetical protein